MLNHAKTQHYWPKTAPKAPNFLPYFKKSLPIFRKFYLFFLLKLDFTYFYFTYFFWSEDITAALAGMFAKNFVEMLSRTIEGGEICFAFPEWWAYVVHPRPPRPR